MRNEKDFSYLSTFKTYMFLYSKNVARGDKQN